MQTHGYERSRPWTLALGLLAHVRALTDRFEHDPCGLEGKLLAIASDLPIAAALAYEQEDYDSMRQRASTAREQVLMLWMNGQVAEHLKLLAPRALIDLRKRVDALDRALADLPDQLFEDDGEQALADAAYL